jgi:hypothetical protein
MRVKRWMSYKRLELLTLSQHLDSPLGGSVLVIMFNVVFLFYLSLSSASVLSNVYFKRDHRSSSHDKS